MLVTVDEVSVQTGQTYEGAERDRVESFIRYTSASIEAYCRTTYEDPVPGAIKSVALTEVRRRLNAEPGMASDRIGDLAQGYEGGSLILTPSSMQALDNYLKWTRPVASSIRLVSPLRDTSLPVPVLQAPEAAVWPNEITISGRTYREGLVQFQTSSNGWDWEDHIFVESLDISDGGYPAWRVLFPPPAQAGPIYWRARYRYDGDTSKWSRAIYTSFRL